MVEKRKLEFFVLRYVPDAVKGEFVNIGLVMFEPGGNDAGFAEIRFTKDWGRVRCLDPQADIHALAALEKDIRSQLIEVRDREGLIRRIEDAFSNLVQLSAVKGCLAEDPAEELKLLTRLYLKRRVVVPQREELEVERQRGVGKRYILDEMQHEFKRAGVWKLLMHGVPISRYGHPKDPFKFDFGYRVGNQIKLFHAVSMSANVDGAVLLATRYQKVTPAMEKTTGAAPMLTALVEAGLDKNRNEVAFAWEMMEESRITVAEVTEMARIAETARVELRA
ncbi:MAG TPA: DUF3037 domain-containing protein [Candidatus Acidoferrales bacterium]|nr:DUF3037 domain-containing protein [Candidatus Acidoferrales bacterium]